MYDYFFRLLDAIWKSDFLKKKILSWKKLTISITLIRYNIFLDYVLHDIFIIKICIVYIIFKRNWSNKVFFIYLYTFHIQKPNENPLSFVPLYCQPSKEYLLFVALNNLSILVREQNIPHGWSYIRSNSLNKINRNFSQRSHAFLFRPAKKEGTRNETKNKCVLCARLALSELRWHQTDCQAHPKKMDKFFWISEMC